MKQIALLSLLTMSLLTACGGASDDLDTTLIPPPPTQAGGQTTSTGQQATDAPLVAPTTTTAALATLPPSPTAAPPTEAPTLIPTLTEEASPEASPSVEASPTIAISPTPSPELFVPGQQDGGTLSAGGAKAYLVDARRFQPLILFVEPTNELNVTLAAYTGDQTGQTTPEGVMPSATADNALAGRPEILVLSPEADGLNTLVIRAVAGEGSFAARLFDLTTPASGVVIQQPDALAAGEEKTYSVTSRGTRPIIAVADPTDQSDIALDILATDGTLLTTANYSGPGGVETAYVLPLGTTDYTVRVREANGGSANYQILVIALE